MPHRMKTIFSDEPIDDKLLESYPYSMFLCGPSPRDFNARCWRASALAILHGFDYDGIVFVPESSNYVWSEVDAWCDVSHFGAWEETDWIPDYDCPHEPAIFDYMKQVEWEKWGLSNATKVVFWIPRSIKGKMPGFTTNIEFGRYIDSGRVLYGRPDWAEHIRYIDWLYNDVTGKEPFNNMNELLLQAVQELRNDHSSKKEK